MSLVESLYYLVKQVLDEEDIEGLLGMGCPADEYDDTARLIVDEIRNATEFGHKELEVELAERIVAEVCNSHFGPFAQKEVAPRIQSYKRVASKIAGPEPDY